MAIPPGAASPRGADRQQQQQQQAPPSQPIPIPISIPASINNNNSGDNNNSFSTTTNSSGGGGSGNNNNGGGGGVLLPPPSPGAATLAARSPLFPFLRPVLSPRRPPYSQWTPPSSPAQWLTGSPPSSPGGGHLLSSSPYSYSSFPSSSSTSYSSTSSSSSSPLRCAVEVFSFDRSCDGAGGAVAGFVGVGVAAAGGGGGGGPPRPRGCDKCTQTGGELQAAAAAAAERRRQPQHSATAPGSLRQVLHSDSDWEPAEASLGGEAIPDVIPPRERSLSESAINPRMERVGQELRRIGDEFNVFVDGQLQRRNFGRQNGRLLHDEAVWLLRFGLYIINRRNL